MGWFTNRGTDPRKCVLAFGVPTTTSDFAQDLRCGARKDFAASLVGRRASTELDLDRFAAAFYANEARCIADVMAAVRTCGVEVVVNVDLVTLYGLFRRFEVVTFVSHWKSDTVHPEDVFDWTAFARKISASDGGILGWLASQMSANMLPTLRRAETGPLEWSSCVAVADDINRVMRSNRFGAVDPTPNRTRPMDGVLNGFTNRQRLDAALSAELHPGNRVEFNDGLHPIEAVADAIPTTFSGILDLTICNSILPAEEIKNNPLKRQFMILANRDPTELRMRLLVYKHTIQIVAHERLNYRDSVLRIREGLMAI